MIWGPISKADERHYRRLDREEARRKAAREKLESRLPFRKAALARVKRGEITLPEAQAIIRKKEATDD